MPSSAHQHPDSRLDSRPRETFSLTLGEIATIVGGRAPEQSDTVVSGLTLATDLVRPGDLFIAAPGAQAHGARYADQALHAGARAVITDQAGAAFIPDDLPCLIVPDPRRAAGPAAAALYRNPAASLTTIGITGTQGKTTTAHLVAAAAGWNRSGTIGSIGITVGSSFFPPLFTTPEAPELQALFAVMREQGLATVAVEASSHALVYGRIDGFTFDAGIFLNLGHDHRDFHPTQADYFAAKSLLLTPDHARVGVVDIDSPWGRNLAAQAPVPVRTLSVRGREADWRAENVTIRPDGSSFLVRSPEGEEVPFTTRLTGAFNVSNILAAVAALVESGAALGELVDGIAELGSVEGRLQRVDFGQDFTAIIDSAHKREAVASALGAIRATGVAGRLITVLGANGKRDSSKRRLMGRFASSLSDIFIVTDDNPYDDDPAPIRTALIHGARSGGAEIIEIGDRREAIAEAVRLAGPDDTVAILGKGHERYHALAGGDIPWYDADVLREVIEAQQAPSN